MIFTDRADAGIKLADKLKEYKSPNTIVLAIPRGGVMVGFEVARALDVPLDLVIPRKIGAPAEPELAIGAVAGSGEVRVLDSNLVRYLGVSQSYIDEEVERQVKEIERRSRLYRGDKPLPDVSQKTVIVVDDGIATGSTMMAAVRWLKTRHPKKLVLAVPVAPPETVQKFIPEVDEIVVLETPQDFFAVGAWYRNFEQTTDDEVANLLKRAWNGYRS